MSYAIPVVEEGWFLRASQHCLTRTKDRGCNPGIIATEDGLVFVDTPQRATDTQAWLKAAREIGRPLLLINTEHHLDHCAGNGFFDVPIVAQEGTRESFFAPSPIWGSSVANVVDMFRRLDGELADGLSGYVATAPQITFRDQLVMSIGGVEIRIVNLPGHLSNSTVVHVPGDGVVFMSDNLFCVEMPWLHEADPRAWIKSIDTVKSWDPSVIVPGHGPVSTPAALDVMRSYLVEFVDRIGHEIAQGRSVEEAQANLDFLPRFVIPTHLSGLAKQVQNAGIARTYNLLANPT